MVLKLGSKKQFVVIISILLLTDIIILFNVPILRQVIGFLFLTILPGLLILQTLKLNKMGFLEKFILTVGLSISFLMLFGLLINSLSLNVSYTTPLATVPLLISLNITFIALAIIGYGVNKDSILSLPDLKLSTSEKAFLIVPILFPALSIFGMHVMNMTDNNILLMFMLFLIPIYVASVCIFNQKFPTRLYPVVIFSISISLLLLLSLRSNHIIGDDVHTEYYYFRTTLNNLHWSIGGHSSLDACLSISLLPTIYQTILNENSEFLFKIFYSLVYSISPLVIYVLSKRYIGESYAFLASCFFMFQPAFLWTEYNPRTNLAVLLFTLSMMVLFSDKIDPVKKRILFIVFMASCMVSHYSTTYIFFIIMLGTVIGMEMLSRKYTVKKIVSLTVVILFFALIFFWYSQVTDAAFDVGVGFIEKTFSNLNMFFVEEARGAPAQALLGEGFQRGIPYTIQFVFTWLTFIYIAIGVLTSIKEYKKMSFPELNFKKPDFLKEKFEVEYWLIAIICSGLSVVIITLPFVSSGYGMERAYSVIVTILSVFFVIGGIMLSKQTFKKSSIKKHLASESVNRKNVSQFRAHLIILLVLIPYFLCVTGVTHQMFGCPYQITLNSEGHQYDTHYIHDQEVISAKWLYDYGVEYLKIYVAGGSSLSLGYEVDKRPNYKGSFAQNNTVRGGYIYLGHLNVVEGKVNTRTGIQDMTEYSHQFVGKHEIYNNGGSEIWK